MEQIRLNGANKELTDEIVSLGTRYGIVTPYTSFLITEDMKDASGRPLRAQASRDFSGLIGPTGGGTGLGPGSARGRSSQYDEAKVDGEFAVARSRAERSLKESNQAPTLDAYTNSTRTVGAKTFILRNGVWVDTAHSDSSTLPVVRLKFGSDEFFAEIGKQRALAEFFALGEKVTVVFNSKVYKVE